MIEQQIARMYPVPNEGQALPRFDAGAHAVRSITIDLTNARNGERIPIGGNFLWLASANLASAAITIAFSRENSSEGIPFKQGTAIKGVRFSEILVTNTAQAGVIVTLIYITEASQALEVVNAGITIATVTLTKGLTLTDAADVAMVAGARTAILAANANRRRAFITNLAAGAATLRIGNSATVAAARGIPVLPGETIVLETTAAISGWNPGGVNQNVAVLEESD